MAYQAIASRGLDVAASMNAFAELWANAVPA
jgi:hypothetical protein